MRFAAGTVSPRPKILKKTAFRAKIGAGKYAMKKRFRAVRDPSVFDIDLGVKVKL